jgi:hypothetical protein
MLLKWAAACRLTRNAEISCALRGKTGRWKQTTCGLQDYWMGLHIDIMLHRRLRNLTIGNNLTQVSLVRLMMETGVESRHVATSLVASQTDSYKTDMAMSCEKLYQNDCPILDSKMGCAAHPLTKQYISWIKQPQRGRHRQHSDHLSDTRSIYHCDVFKAVT